LSTPGSAAGEPVATLGERGLIDRIRRRLPPPPTPLVVGIGDDAAVAQPDRNRLQVLTTDALVDGVHFDRRFCSLEDAGYKALAVNVSDIAAMGAEPRLALVSLLLPPGVTVAEVDALVDGLAAMAAEARVGIAGGNITSTQGPLAIDITVTGAVRPRRYLTRSGGRAGDELYVTGRVGAAAAGLGWLLVHGRTPVARPEDVALAECVERYRRPSPRSRIGRILSRSRAVRACMDLSDGLADAVRQVAEASGTGAAIDAAAVPVHPGAAAWFASRGTDPLRAAIAGGDDYELLFALPPKRRRQLQAIASLSRGVPITRIGTLTRERDLVVTRDGRPEPLPQGFSHF
jgi:thiamine-monophosphate kinase